MAEAVSLGRLDYTRVMSGEDAGKLAIFLGLGRERDCYRIKLVTEGRFVKVPLGSLEKIGLEDLESEEASVLAREWIEEIRDPTWNIEMSDEDLLDAESYASAILCARDDLDDRRSEPEVIGLLSHHSKVPAVVQLLGMLLARNEELLCVEERMSRVRSSRYKRVWQVMPKVSISNSDAWMVDHGGLCP